jgi:hypothetical protein
MGKQSKKSQGKGPGGTAIKAKNKKMNQEKRTKNKVDKLQRIALKAKNGKPAQPNNKPKGKKAGEKLDYKRRESEQKAVINAETEVELNDDDIEFFSNPTGNLLDADLENKEKRLSKKDRREADKNDKKTKKLLAIEAAKARDQLALAGSKKVASGSDSDSELESDGEGDEDDESANEEAVYERGGRVARTWSRPDPNQRLMIKSEQGWQRPAVPPASSTDEAENGEDVADDAATHAADREMDQTMAEDSPLDTDEDRDDPAGPGEGSANPEAGA